METEKTGRTCQSCGMPITKGADFGTDADGRKFLEYCRFCFKGGKFTDDGITMEQKIAKNIDIAVNMGMPRETAEQLANSTLPKLKRWAGK